eukprot:gi/632975459/ref/XP_007904240.1/ PREDICTED: alkylated DNA repair protein alkB homolog 1 [Callorhinchus milii]
MDHHPKLLHRPITSVQVVTTQLNVSAVSDGEACKAGLQPINKWKAYGIDGYPGFMFIVDPFLPGWQRYWTKRCLKTYPRKPNICNLDLHMSTEETQDLWERSKEQLRRKRPGKREGKSLLEKLRWVTLGYHYNWDTKRYSANHYTAFPSELAHLSERVAAACGFQQFKAEAGILNYYHFDSSLGIHVDESELDHSKPLLSFSFGQSAVFLLGGRRREDAPLPLFMHSGDIMVMSGKSRLLYHAIPRVLPCQGGGTLPGCLEQAADGADQPEWDVCATYLQDSRINMTVRQVLGPGQRFTDESESESLSVASQSSSHQHSVPEPQSGAPEPQSGAPEPIWRGGGEHC